MEDRLEHKTDRIDGALFKILLNTKKIILCDTNNYCTAKERINERLCGWYLSDLPLSQFCQYRHPPQKGSSDTTCGVGKFFPKEMKRKHNEFLEIRDGKD